MGVVASVLWLWGGVAAGWGVMAGAAEILRRGWL